MRQHNNKQFFMFGMPIKDLSSKVSKYPAHFFAGKLDGGILMVNSLQAELLEAASSSDLVGKTFFEASLRICATEEEAKVMNDAIIKNNNTVMKHEMPQLFQEVGFGKECLCIKARLLDSCNHVVGMGGVAFYFHQITLKDMAALTNELFSLNPIANSIKNDSISKVDLANKLSCRELECVHYLVRGMTYKEIAKVLNIGSRTVETHIGHIKTKLGCYNRSDIVSMVFESKKSE